MTGPAIVLMIFSIVLMWGGLVVSILRLRRYPEMSLDADEPGGAPGGDGSGDRSGHGPQGGSSGSTGGPGPAS